MKTICVLLIVSLITAPCFCMPVPSRPAKENPIPVQGGGDIHPNSRVFGLALLAVIGLVYLGRVISDSVDNDDNSDNDKFVDGLLWALIIPASLLILFMGAWESSAW